MHKHDYDLEDALALASQRKVAIFAATHNEGKTKAMAFPARDATVIPVSSCDHKGNLSSSACMPKEGKTNFSALGETIPPFWLGSQSYLPPEILSGSSFAAPIAVAIYATTLAAARLSFRRGSDEELLKKLKSPAVRERLMLALSTKNTQTKYHVVDPQYFWSEREGRTEAEIRRHIEHVDDGIPYS